MKPTALLSAFLSVLSLSQASPVANPDANGWGPQPTCLSQNVASQVVTQFSSLLTNFNATIATSLLSPIRFRDTSDSINFLGGYPMGAVTFPNAKAFIAGQGSQPPIGFKVINIDAVTCEGTIVFRWIANVGPSSLPIKGIDVINVGFEGKNVNTVGPGGWRITDMYSEFNSGEWLEAIGGACTRPTQS